MRSTMAMKLLYTSLSKSWCTLYILVLTCSIATPTEVKTIGHKLQPLQTTNGHVWTSSTKRYQNQEQYWRQHEKNGSGNTLCLNHDTLITLYLLMLICGILPPHEWRKLDAKPQPLHTTNGHVWTSSTKRHQDQVQL